MSLKILSELLKIIIFYGHNLVSLLGYPYSIMMKKNVSESKTVYMNGLASSFPLNEYNQNEMKEMFIQNHCGGREIIMEKDLNFIDRIFAATLIDKCYVNLPKNRLFERMNRETYTTYIKDTMLILACQAARNALLQAKLLPSEITHVVYGTMTASIRAPSLDINIIRQLDLNLTVKRLNVEAMGCLTGFRLTGLCRDLAIENERNIVLLIVCDIRSSLGNQLTRFTSMQPIDKSNVIVSAMFRDSGGAAIFSQKSRSATDLRIIEHRSTLVPNSFDRVRLEEYNDGTIHLFLHKELPESVFDYVPSFINAFLAEHNIDITSCLLALHTGGPRIIRGIQKALNLRPEQLFATWYVMKNYGNLSGASNLVVLEHLMRHRQSSLPDTKQDIPFPSDLSRYSHIIGLSIGPGLGIECVIFHI